MKAFRRAGVLIGCLLFLQACAVALDRSAQKLATHQWKVEGNGLAAEQLRLWLGSLQLDTKEEQQPRDRRRFVLHFSPSVRKKRVIALDPSGNAIRYLLQTTASVRLEDDQGQSYGAIQLFAVRQYSSDTSIDDFLHQLGEEMDLEISRRVQLWLSQKGEGL